MVKAPRLFGNVNVDMGVDAGVIDSGSSVSAFASASRARSPWWLFAIALPCCGLVPSSETLTPFPSDGLTGFGDAEPIEVCLGTARVVAPDDASGADAVCVPEGASGRACTSNDSCVGIERCICGRCIVEACQGGGDTCGEDRICRDKRCTKACATASDCAEHEVCSAGGCARSCSGDGDCHFGERCDALDNTCVVKLCSDAMPCGAGRRCEPVSVTGELHEPEIATIGSKDVAYVELRPFGAGATSAIYRARIDSPTRWTAEPTDPIVADATQSTGGPSALVDGQRVELYFALGDGAAIARAVSTDGGKTFMRDGDPVLTAQSGWENGWIGSPSVVRFGNAAYLFYEGGPRAGIGLARLDGGHAARVSSDPIVTPEQVNHPVFWHDVTEVGAPYAVVAGEALRVYFTARGVEGSDAIVGDASVPADANDSIGMAASMDAKQFLLYPSGPVLARVTNLRTYLGEREASVRLRDGGGAEITFVSADASGKSVSGLSRAGN